METAFEEQLRELINRESLENKSDTPDWILSAYLMACLDAFNRGVNLRDGWRGENVDQMPETVHDCPCGCGGQYIPPTKKEN